MERNGGVTVTTSKNETLMRINDRPWQAEFAWQCYKRIYLALLQDFYKPKPARLSCWISLRFYEKQSCPALSMKKRAQKKQAKNVSMQTTQPKCKTFRNMRQGAENNLKWLFRVSATFLSTTNDFFLFECVVSTLLSLSVNIYLHVSTFAMERVSIPPSVFETNQGRLNFQNLKVES